MNKMNERKPCGYWNEKTVLAEAKKEIELYGDLPSYPKLMKNNRGDLANAISRRGGFKKFRELLGIKKEDNYWTEENTLAEARKVVDERGYLPSQQELGKMKKNNLANAIRIHGGFHKIRGKLNLKEKIKISGYWNEENILNETKKFVKEYGDLPSQQELKKLKKGDLADAINRYIGFSKIREKLGLKGTNPNGYWNEENTLAEAKQVLDELGYLPTQKELNQLNKSNLANAISRNGGFFKFRKILGETKQTSLEETLRAYVGE